LRTIKSCQTTKKKTIPVNSISRVKKAPKKKQKKPTSLIWIDECKRKHCPFLFYLFSEKKRYALCGKNE